MPRAYYILSFVLAAAISTIAGWAHYQSIRSITVSAVITSQTHLKLPVFQLFYDTGKGYRQQDSCTFLLDPEAPPQHFTYDIPSSVLYGLRIDMLNGAGTITLENFSLLTHYRETFFTLDKRAALQQNQIEALEILPGKIKIKTTPGANDPYIYANFSPPLRPPVKEFKTPHITFALKLFTVLSLFFCGLLWVVSDNKLSHKKTD